MLDIFLRKSSNFRNTRIVDRKVGEGGGYLYPGKTMVLAKFGVLIVLGSFVRW